MGPQIHAERRSTIDFLTTDIGRGHRYYLEGLRKALAEKRPDVCEPTTVAKHVSGFGAGVLWTGIRALYRIGSQPGAIGGLYNRLRSGRDPDARDWKLEPIKRGLTSWGATSSGPLIVDHPLLATLLHEIKDVRPLIYMHGELVAPRESQTTWPDLTIIPTEEVAESFVKAGAKSESLFVSGLCLESFMTIESTRSHRARSQRRGSLTGAYYSSGAEPDVHCKMLIGAVQSSVRCGYRAFVFGRRNGRLARYCQRLSDSGIREVNLVTFESVEEEEHELQKVFDQIDFVVAPSHERVNWCIGAGIPFFWLRPEIGSFAPLNAVLAAKQGNARSLSTLDDANKFGETLRLLVESGAFGDMNTMPLENIHGFERAASEILSQYY